ncbi:MAG: hypothetical protein KJ000_19010 [Pirellulaceae bacterium]|nr:hypothetical protein [Pirellulaceae bacterium]
MSASEQPAKKAVLFCTCSGACPSMTGVDFWALAERVRVELGDRIEFMALHPRLCEEDGERLMGQILSERLQFITAACAEQRQQKLLRDGFQKADVPMDAQHWIPVSMAKETTDTVFQRIKAAVQDQGDTATKEKQS